MGFSDKNTGVGCHGLLQEILPTQGSNPDLLCLLHWQVNSFPLSHWGSPPYTCAINASDDDNSTSEAQQVSRGLRCRSARGPVLPWCRAEPPNVVLAACPAHRLGTSDLWAAGMERPGHLQEEVLHDVVVVGGAAVWEEAGGKDDNGVETFAVVPCGEAAGEKPWTGLGRALSQF